MSFETWAAFAAASSVLLVIPGPTVLLVVSYALGQGWRTALPMAIGVALGFGLGTYIASINGVPYRDFIAPGLVASATMWAASFECTSP